MKVKKLYKTSSIVDIFLGEGWKNWSRYRFIGKIYTHLAGNRLPRHLIEKAKEQI